MSVASPPGPAKKGMGPLGWIAIGCGVLLVLGLIGVGACGLFLKKKVDAFKENPAKAAAELIVSTNPDLEKVSEDDKAGTITVRNKKTGDTVTLNFEDIKNGKFSVKTDKGTTTFDGNSQDGGSVKVTDEKGETASLSGGAGAPKGLPSWLPVYPGGGTQGSFETSGPQGHAGGFTVTTKDPIEKVAEFYEKQLKGAGIEVTKNLLSSNDKTTGGTITGKTADGKKEAGVFLASADGSTTATVTFNEKP